MAGDGARPRPQSARPPSAKKEDTRASPQRPSSALARKRDALPPAGRFPGQTREEACTPPPLSPAPPLLPSTTPGRTGASPFPYTSLPARAEEMAPIRSRTTHTTDGSTAARLSGHPAWPVKDAEVVSGGGKVDWRAIADADRMIFRSSSLKLEAALAELNLAGSQVDSAAVMLGDHQDNNLRSAKPDAFRTALSCRMLTSLAEEMVSEQHREVFRRISYELMLSIYDGYCAPPRNELGRAHGPASRRADLLENEKMAATGFTFDLVPFFCKSQSLEEESLLLRKEVTELRAWKVEHVPILRELREDVDIMTREKDAAQLTAQIATVKHRRLEERLEAVSKYAASESADLRRRIALEVEQGHSLRTSLFQLQKDVENMVPKTAVETMRGQLADLVDLVHELQVESLLSCVESIVRAQCRLPTRTSADTALEMLALTFDTISNLPSML